MDLLILLVERHGQLVTRADIVARLWGPDVFVDVEMGVNTAISKVRQALRDAPDAPAVPGDGRRARATGSSPPVDVVHARGRRSRRRGPPAALPRPLRRRLPDPAAVRRRPGRPGWTKRTPAIAVAALAALLAVDCDRRPGRLATAAQPTGRPSAVSLAVLPFVNLGRRRRSRLPGRRAHRRNQRLAGTHRSRGTSTVKGRTQPYRGTTKTAAQIGQELVGRLPGRELDPRRRLTRPRDGVAAARRRSGARLVPALRPRGDQPARRCSRSSAPAIAEQVRLTLSPESLRGVQTRQAGNASAYDAYLRGRYQRNRRTADGNRQAVALSGRPSRWTRPMPWPGPTVGCLRGQHDQRRCAPGCGRRAGAGGGPAGGGDRPVVARKPRWRTDTSAGCSAGTGPRPKPPFVERSNSIQAMAPHSAPLGTCSRSVAGRRRRWPRWRARGT